MNRAQKMVEYTVRVLSYNILADQAAQTGGFVGPTAEQLEWDARKPVLVAQIKQYNPDVFALQECNKIDDFREAFLDYESEFVPKAAPGETSNFGDGVALFWRKSRFVLGGIVVRSHKSATTAAALGVLLRDPEEEKDLCLITCHLKAKPGKENAQARAQQMEDVVKQQQRSPEGAGVPTILAGDFNAVYEYGSFDEPLFVKVLNAKTRFRRSFLMKWSTYKQRVLSDFDKGGIVKRTIDHMYHEGSIRCLSYIEAPTEPTEMLPNSENPSDHLPLVADFVLM